MMLEDFACKFCGGLYLKWKNAKLWIGQKDDDIQT